MHLILTGATGLVGSAVLDTMVKMNDVSRISILSRRPVKMAEDIKDSRINVIIHNDFNKYDKALLNQLKGASGCVWALGISQSSVSKEEYIKITKDYALAAAEAFQHLPSDEEPFNFIYVSGDGTTFEPGHFTPIFARVKGETEIALSEMRKSNPLFLANTIRPSWPDFADHKSIHEYIPAQGMLRTGIVGVFGPVMRGTMKSRWSPTEPLGRFINEMAMGKWDNKLEGPGFEKLGAFTVVENAGFRRLAGLDGSPQ